MTELSVRRLGAADIDALLAVEAACFSAPWSRDSYLHELSGNDLAFYWGLFVDGDNGPQLAGFAGYWLIVDEGHITNVAVAPARQRQGLGRLLVQTLINACLAQGGRRMTLEVRAGNRAAIGLYEGFGFSVQGRRRDYYDRPREDALIMWKELP